VKRAHQERIRFQSEDFIEARGDVVGELQHGAHVLHDRLLPTGGPGSQDPVVDDLGGGREKRMIRLPRLHPRHRACGRRSAGALGAVGEELGVALVEPDDGVAQPFDREDLAPAAPPLRVDLGQLDVRLLVGADIETPAGKPAGGYEDPTQSQRVAEGRQWLVPAGRVPSQQQGAPREEHCPPVIRRVGGMIHAFRLVAEQGGKRSGIPRGPMNIFFDLVDGAS